MSQNSNKQDNIYWFYSSTTDLFCYLFEIALVVACSVSVIFFPGDAAFFNNKLKSIVHEAAVAPFIDVPITVNKFLL